MDLNILNEQAECAINELISVSGVSKGDIVVVGCSSSEIIGGHIGKNSSIEAAQTVFSVIYSALKKKGIYLAAQCCEHLNRALIIERECAEKYGYEIVNVVPWQHAGGSFATTAYASFDEPVAVEHIKAHAGLDIGDTLIGMHLRDVAVPVRLSARKLGEANLVAARTRAKFIGGERAHYQS